MRIRFPVPGIAALLLSLASCADEMAEGVLLFEAGKPKQALHMFRLAERRAGNSASTELLYNRALAALAAAELSDAETSAERLASRGALAMGETAVWGTRDFLRGLASYQRAAWASEEAKLPEADPTALPQALLHARAAIRHFRHACMTRKDWPLARRNLERCLALLDSIEKQRDEALKQQKRKKEKSKEEENEKGEEEEKKIQSQTAPLAFSAAEMRRIFAKLLEKEEEKRQLRRALQLRGRFAVEKDW